MTMRGSPEQTALIRKLEFSTEQAFVPHLFFKHFGSLCTNELEWYNSICLAGTGLTP